MSPTRHTKKLVNTLSYTGAQPQVHTRECAVTHRNRHTHFTPISHVHCLLLTQACKQQTDRTTLELTCQCVASTASKVYCVTASHGLVPSHHFTRHCGWHSLRLGLVSYYRSIFFCCISRKYLNIPTAINTSNALSNITKINHCLRLSLCIHCTWPESSTRLGGLIVWLSTS